jgi:hypothetical protein
MCFFIMSFELAILHFYYICPEYYIRPKLHGADLHQNIIEFKKFTIASKIMTA